MFCTAVLGRGPSLRDYPSHSDRFEKIYIVNPFAEEIDTLGLEHFAHKHVVHLVGKSAAAILTQTQYKSLASIQIRANRPADRTVRGYPVRIQGIASYMSKRGFPSVSPHLLVQALEPGLSWEEYVTKLESEFADEVAQWKEAHPTTTGRYWPTTGMFAIDSALNEMVPDQMYLFGFELYSTGKDRYFIRSQNSCQPLYAVKLMKFYLEHLVKEFRTTQFFSAAQIEIDAPNWTVL